MSLRKKILLELSSIEEIESLVLRGSDCSERIFLRKLELDLEKVDFFEILDFEDILTLDLNVDLDVDSDC